MSTRSQKYKGKFTPDNPSTYMGDVDNIIYRSGWERRAMKYFDVNPGVLKWASEEVAKPYYLSLIHISNARRRTPNKYAVC